MKKWLKTIIPVFALTFLLLIPGIQAQAGTITSVSASAGTDQITVSGVAGDDVLSVAIFVYDSTGTNLVQMESVAVDAGHAYTDTITVPAGTYVIKVADYEGGDFSQTSVTVGTADTTKYSISVTSGGNGTVTASATEAAAGTTVTITATPNSGYKFKAWTVENGGVTLADSSSASTTFTMPAANVSIKATFEQSTSGGGTAPSGGGTTTPGNNTSNTTSVQTTAPKTADENHLLLWVVVLMGALAILAGMTITNNKRKIR